MDLCAILMLLIIQIININNIANFLYTDKSELNDTLTMSSCLSSKSGAHTRDIYIHIKIARYTRGISLEIAERSTIARGMPETQPGTPSSDEENLARRNRSP